MLLGYMYYAYFLTTV